MTDWNYAALAEGLSLLDSHSVYTGDAAGLILLTENGVDLSTLHPQTHRQVEQSIKSRGLGGWLEPTEELLYTGWIVSGVVCRQVFGEAAGDKYMGRGFAHQANIEQMRKAAKEQDTESYLQSYTRDS